MKRIVFIILMFFLLISTTHALEECTPSEEYEKYMALSDEEKKNFIEPEYCKEIMYKEETDNFFVSLFNAVTNTISASMLDSSYNAVNDGLISTPQNQGTLGTCWAFSSISAVEANARKNNIGNYNLSEKHMIYSLLSAGYSDSAGKKGKYYTTNFNGGKVTYAASYFFNNYGQLLENEWTYTDQATQITNSAYKKGKKILNVSDFELSNVGSYSACTSSEITYIKKQIINHGSVQATMYIDNSLFKDSSNNYYISKTTDSNLPNHGISIVGWDDNISKTKFGASRNGAFIIKNSWGPSWSDDGYFYISYDDHFVCKNTATFSGVTKQTYENTYASADQIGVPTITFNGVLFTSAKFKKKSNSDYIENLVRVSYPVGADLKYYVYLVPDNNLTSNSNWILLKQGSSDVYGIKSVNISNQNITSNYFTIVVKYVTNSGASSSVFTMCNNVDETSQMDISSGLNYFATNMSNWADMKSIKIQNNTISCEPNIFAYTNNELIVADLFTDGNITINSITPYSNSVSNKKFTVSFNNNDVNTSLISYKITNSSGTNVTSSFTITPNYNTNKVVVESNGKVSGTFNFIIKYGTKEVKTTFNITESVSINNSSLLSVSGNNMFINLSNKETIIYKKLIDGLNIYNSNIQVLDKKGKSITNNNAVLTTNSKLKTNNKTYTIIIKGDVNCDGSITALDYIEVRKHIMGYKISDSGMLKASDLDNNDNISALDYISIRTIIMR